MITHLKYKLRCSSSDFGDLFGELHYFARFVSSSGGGPNDVAFRIRSTRCRRQHSAASQNDSFGRVSAPGE
ncbi:hypothetical protein TB2_006454 [Malus domestica]